MTAITRATHSSLCTHFIDTAFACVGGDQDTLAAMYYLPLLNVHAIYLNDTRENHEQYERLQYFIAPSHPHAEATKLLCPHHKGAGSPISSGLGGA
jgi:hypothetical protein